MRSTARRLSFLITLALLVGPPAVSAGARPEPAPGAAASDEVPPASDDACALDSLADAPLAPARVALLEQAFEAATKLPLEPHAKTRSRLQEEVVAAWIELGQQRRALAAIERIEGWRRTATLADLALDCARRGDGRAARALLTRAAQPVAGEVEPDAAWRRERVQARIARAFLALGDRENAAKHSLGVSESERGPITGERAAGLAPDELEAALEALDRAAAQGSFDEARNALATGVRLFERFYGDAGRRERIAKVIERCGTKLPVPLRVETALELARSAIAHEDRPYALGLLAQARAAIADAPWTPDLSIPLRMRIAAVRAGAGEASEARAEAEAASLEFDAVSERTLDIDRADVLRSIAETYASAGDGAAALATWRRAVEAGVSNPNSRPRAEDLVATCRQMALLGPEPDVELTQLLTEVLEGLGAPW